MKIYYLFKFWLLNIQFNDIRNFESLNLSFRRYIRNRTKHNINPLWVVLKSGINLTDIGLFISHIRKMEVDWVIRFFIKTKPSIHMVYIVLSSVNKYFPMLINYYISLNPTACNLANLIISNKLYQTNEMLDYFFSLNPLNDEIIELLIYCQNCRKNETVINFLKNLNSTDDILIRYNEILENF